MILEKSVGSRVLAQAIDSTALQKNPHLTGMVKLRFFQSTVKPITSTIIPRPTDLSRMIRVTLTIGIFASCLIFHRILYAQADVDIIAEEGVYAKCIGCHSPAYHRTGPKHCGLLGRKAGSEAGFTYTAALKNSGIVWTTETLDLFLMAPLKMVPGTNMGVSGVSSSVERSQLIRYLSRLNEDNPLCN